MLKKINVKKVIVISEKLKLCFEGWGFFVRIGLFHWGTV